MHSRYGFLTAALPIVILGFAVEARASSFAESIIHGNNPVIDSGATTSSVVSGGNSASSFVNPLTETMGAAVASDGTAPSVSANSSHHDDWACLGCSPDALAPPIQISANITFDAVVSKGLALGQGEFDLVARYSLGLDVFTFSASADSAPMTADANFGGNPVNVSTTTDANGNVHLSTSLVRPFMCPCFANNSPVFTDFESLQLEMEGSGFVDASHTFTVTLTPLDPGILMTSADGRVIGSAPAGGAVPEPASVLLVGTGLVVARRYRRRESV